MQRLAIHYNNQDMNAFFFFFFQPPFLSLTLHFFSSDSFKCYVQLRTEHELSFFNQFTLIGADAE